MSEGSYVSISSPALVVICLFHYSLTILPYCEAMCSYVLIGISLIISDVEHLSACLLANYIYLWRIIYSYSVLIFFFHLFLFVGG